MGGVMLDPNTLNLIQNHTKGYVAHWLYVEHGRPVMTTVRYDYNGIKTFRQFKPDKENWIEGTPHAPYPLYGLHSLGNVSSLEAVIICEGEKCASLLHQFGWPCVSTALGAKNVPSTDFTPLRNFKDFIILRDNDKPGISYAREIAMVIKRQYPDAEILVCNLCPEIPGGDVVDWVKKHPLSGHPWNGFDTLSVHDKGCVSQALLVAIPAAVMPIAECPDVQFKEDTALFEGDPQPPQLKLRSVPEFPVELLPESIQRYLALCAYQMCTPVIYQATVFLAIVGGLIGRAVQLNMRPGHDWKEVANAWAMIVGQPSARKSPTLRQMFDLLNPIEEEAKQEYAHALKGFNDAQNAEPKPKGKHPPPHPKRRRLLTDDATTAKLRELLSENPRGLILRSDELKGQLEKLDRDGNEGDRSFLMQCWAGLGLYNEDRIARGSHLQIPLTLSYIGCIQPVCLAHYVQQSVGESKGADGLLQRFQMIAFPDLNPDYQICKEEMPDEWKDAMVRLMTNIECKMRDSTRILKFSEEAQVYFNQWETTLQQNARSGIHPPHWESHLGKQSKLLASLCIILHVITEVLPESTEQNEIALSTIQTAEKLVSHYLEHALRCYDSVESLTMSDARKILNAILKKKLKTRFKAAEIYQNGIGGMDHYRATNALQLLQDLQCVALHKVFNRTGRSSEYWIVHPKLFENPS